MDFPYPEWNHVDIPVLGNSDEVQLNCFGPDEKFLSLLGPFLQCGLGLTSYFPFLPALRAPSWLLMDALCTLAGP